MTKAFTWTIPLLGIVLFSNLDAAPRRGYYDNDQTIALTETRDSLDTLRTQVHNQELEIKSFEERLETLNTLIDSLRDQVQDTHTAHKEMVKGNSQTLEMKLATLENTAKSLSADIQQLKTHANETSTSLQFFKQKMGEWDSKITAQNQNIENLQSALQSVLEAFNVKAEPAVASPSSGGRTYKVKAGDSLEKIARAHQTTIQAIKELNGMANDKIVVGKTLRIPN